MNFRCPHCSNPSKISDPKAGRFKPKCPKCKKPFILVIDNAGKVHCQLPRTPEKKTPDSDSTSSNEHQPRPDSDQSRNVDATSQFKQETTQQLEAANTQEIRKVNFSASDEDPLDAKTQEINTNFEGASPEDVLDPKTQVINTDFEGAVDEDPIDAKTQEINTDFSGAAEDELDPKTQVIPNPMAEITQGFENVAFEAGATAPHVTTPPASSTGGSDQPNHSNVEETGSVQATIEHVPNEDTSSKPAKVRDKIPKRLGGYKLDKMLGKGGMGTVFLATQVSLDREVAIKILKPSLTQSPAFVSRFVREAYAAAQLVHHNVVQIYDIGSQGDVHYFSMELVKGDSLAGVLKRQRRLDCDTAAGYILQAARGLKFAHDQGMVHRDVKPANLLLDEHGIVKVADLGLVKIDDDAADEMVADNLGAETHHKKDEDSQITQFGVSVGTPTYMAPEQWKTSSEVDQRADIYSLGCTFYVLVTGKLPFDGKTPKEVVTKVITENAIPPELLVKDIPKRISVIVNQMIAKEPTDRYSDMGKLISDLEEYLGVSSTGAFSPSERHVEILEKCVEDYNHNPMAKFRKTIFQCGLGLALLLFLGGFFFSSRFAMAVLGTVATTGLSYFVIRGLFEKTHLFSRTRDYLFSNQVWDWVTMGITAVVSIVLAVFLMGIGGSLVAALLGPLIGIGLYFGVDKMLSIKRKPATDEAEKLFKVLRLRGLNEDLLRQFVCKFSGNNWEEFFEEIFGYPAKLNARNWLKGETGKSRKSFRWWRDPLIRWVDRRFDSRDTARQIHHLEKVEMQKLIAQGVDKADAKIRARNIAQLMTENAEAWKQSQSQVKAQATNVQGQTVVDANQPKRPTLSNLSRNLDEKLKNRGPKVTMADRFHASVSFFIGPRTRFLIGVILFGLCLWWMQSNGKVAALSKASFTEAVEILFSQNAYTSDGVLLDTQSKPVSIPFVPESVLRPLNSINHGWIGLIFVFSATIWGWLVTVPCVAAACVALLGTEIGVIPEQGFMFLTAENLALIVGVFIAVAGCIMLKPKTEQPL